MKTYKTTGIAIKSLRLGEADKIITFLTAGGKVSAVAKGIRRTSSKFGGRLEPGNDLELVLARGRALDTVTQVSIKKARPWLWNDLDKLEVAFAILELADKLTPEAVEGDRLLELTAAALDRLEVELRLPLLLLAFDIKALAMTGFLPYFSACVTCGGKTGLNQIGQAEGGVICDNCFSGQRSVKVGKEAKELVRQLLGVRLLNLDSVMTHTGIINEVRRIVWEHVMYHVHADFRARTGAGTSGR
ncbi:MAG: DNA repair protein RecO [Actinomycetota bacterium]|nr:DNA repair protein RecO [Actinomycetota bacterium]